MSRSEYSAHRPAIWSAEQPNLYLLTVALLDARGRTIEATAIRTGFRSVKVKDRQLLINGRAVLIKGVTGPAPTPSRGSPFSAKP